MSGAGPDWAQHALGLVLARARATAEEVGQRFPLYADPETGRWTTTARGSWTGGHWAGLQWLAVRHSGSPADLAAARACTGRLADRVGADTATRGMILWYGTALADSTADELRDRAARACLDAFDAGLGVVPWGGAFGGPRLVARADGAPGLVPLLAHVGEAGRAAAYAHLGRHLVLCLAESPPRPAWEAVPGGGWRPLDEPPPGWSRTAAWLLLAVADGLSLPGAVEPAELRSAARTLAALRLADGAPPVPRAEGRKGPPDTSAAAIEAVAALKLAELARTDGDGRAARQLTARAELVLHLLCTRRLSPAGGLLDGCYDAGRGLAVRHELVWGDFFLALGLAVLTGLVTPFAA
ncbi:sugar ABC transporter permease [Kitasatospora sp. KL5]|uniref:sugar ABC transporter permease n=1 Tax=Kitasatospora sp. KL5 TaxID=3425125 RepID=UPI003D6DC316